MVEENFLPSTSCTNAYILYKTDNRPDNKLTDRQFRLEVIRGLFSTYHNPVLTMPTQPGEPVHRLNGLSHHIHQILSSPRQCVVCSIPAEKVRSHKESGMHKERYLHIKRTSFQCKTCIPMKALCVVPCFEIYHTKEKPSQYWYNTYYVYAQT